MSKSEGEGRNEVMFANAPAVASIALRSEAATAVYQRGRTGSRDVEDPIGSSALRLPRQDQSSKKTCLAAGMCVEVVV